MLSFDTETLRDLRDRADRACQETRVLVEQLKSSTERARDYLDDAYDKPRDANEGRALMADRAGRPGPFPPLCFPKPQFGKPMGSGHTGKRLPQQKAPHGRGFTLGARLVINGPMIGGRRSFSSGIAGKDRSEQLPALTVELHHLELLRADSDHIET